MKQESPVKRIRLTVKQMKDQIASKKGNLDKTFSSEYLNDTYLLNDGKALVSFASHGYLYNSMAELKSWINYLHNGRTDKPQHILEGKLLYGQRFADHVPEFIKLITATCGLKDQPPSLEQLKSIDRFIKNNSKKPDFEGLFFSSIVAYIGEIIRKRFPGSTWTSVKSKLDPSVWEPYILFNDKQYDPFTPAYRELYEEFAETNRISIYDRVVIELNR